jgi:hypothetical protein
MGLIKLCKNLQKLSRLIDTVEERDDYTIVKLKGNVVIETEGHTVVGSKEGCLVLSHPLTSINPINGMKNTESTKIVDEHTKNYLNRLKYKLDINKEVDQWQAKQKHMLSQQ